MRKVKMMMSEMPCVGINGVFSSALLTLNPFSAAEVLDYLRRSENCGVRNIRSAHFVYYYEEDAYGNLEAAFCVPNYIVKTMEACLNK